MPTTLPEGPALFVSLLHIVLASATTIHTLINKRDVPAAIGWIGVAWLSPFFGALLYVAFGVNRVRRRALRLRGPTPSARLSATNAVAPKSLRERLLTANGKVTSRDAESCAEVERLASGDEAYPRMLAAIDAATTSIGLSTYIFRADDSGSRFIDALGRAQRRGVAVRVLIDGFGGGFVLSPAYHRLHRENVPVARFMHSTLPWKMPFIDLRLHKKVLVIDGETAFVGGLNIGDENVLATAPPSPVLDIHFLLRGGVVRQVAQSFLDDWSFAAAETLPEEQWLKPAKPLGERLARVIDSGPDQEIDQLVLVLLSAINCAERSIKIATPYFLPDDRMITALQLAALRGVLVDLVLPEVNNHRLIAWAARATVSPLLESGCRLWLSPPPFDHSKLMTVDDEWSLIGSANWDTRSLRLNFELTVEIYDAVLARRLAAMIDIKCARPLTLKDIRNRWFPTVLRDSAARLMMPYL